MPAERMLSSLLAILLCPPSCCYFSYFEHAKKFDFGAEGLRKVIANWIATKPIPSSNFSRRQN